MFNVFSDVSTAVDIPALFAMVLKRAKKRNFVFDLFLVSVHEDVVLYMLLELDHVFEVSVMQLVLQVHFMSLFIGDHGPISQQYYRQIELSDFSNVLHP